MTEHGFSVLWSDEQDNSTQGCRSVDMVIQRHETLLYAEVTHYREEPLRSDVTQMLSFFGKEQVPPGVYALTVGDGQPPIAQLRGALTHALATGPLTSLGIHVKGWSIRQLVGQPSAASVDRNALTLQQARFAVLTDRMIRAFKKKRRQVRDAGSRDVLLAIILLDRNASAFLEFIASQPKVLSPLVYGSTSASSSVRPTLAIGAVRSDHFPPVPVWTLALPEDATGKNHIWIDVPTIRISRLNELREHRMLEKQIDRESAERAVYYATVTVVSARSASDEAKQVVEIM